MKVVKQEKKKIADGEAVYYTMDDNFQIDTIYGTLKSYETGSTKIGEIHCDTFDDYDNALHKVYNNVESFYNYCKNDHPSVRVFANYVDKNSNAYKFSISMNTNSNVLEYSVRRTIATNALRRQQLEKMYAEIEKKSQTNNQNKVNKF